MPVGRVTQREAVGRGCRIIEYSAQSGDLLAGGGGDQLRPRTRSTVPANTAVPGSGSGRAVPAALWARACSSCTVSAAEGWSMSSASRHCDVAAAAPVRWRRMSRDQGSGPAPAAPHSSTRPAGRRTRWLSIGVILQSSRRTNGGAPEGQPRRGHQAAIKPASNTARSRGGESGTVRGVHRCWLPRAMGASRPCRPTGGSGCPSEG